MRQSIDKSQAIAHLGSWSLNLNTQKQCMSKEAESKMKGREEQIMAMARASHDALIMIDASDKIHFWSNTAEKMFGWTAEEAMGQSMHRLTTLPEECNKALNGLKHFSKTGTGPVIDAVMEFNALRKDGSIFPVERSVASFKIKDTFYAVGSIRDISDRKKKEEQLRLLATTDGLTGLYNRRRFMELIQKESKTSMRHFVFLSLIMFDADKFKVVNDTYGHEAGDRVLVEISRITRQVVRETDFPSRIGGEEFVVGLPHTDAEGAIQLAERLRSSFEASEVETTDGRIIHYTVSFGVSSLDPASPVDVETLMKQADKALYQAKEKGRNRVEQY